MAAQQPTARILGVVTDPSGSFIAGAKITVTNGATAQTRFAQSGPSGEYSLQQLAIGEYTMMVEAPGFSSSPIAASCFR